MTRTRRTSRWIAALALAPVLALSACGSDGFGGDGGASVTIVGQKFTEADIMTQLYKGLLEDAGFETDVKNLGTRDIYLGPLKEGDVQVSADYLASMTESLNKDANGEDAEPVASPDADATLAELNKLGEAVGLKALEPAKAVDANAYAVTKEFAEENNLTTLSDLGKLEEPVALAANSDCKERRDCAKGLTEVYGIEISRIEPLGFGSPETKTALANGEVQLGQVGTTDATLDGLGLVLLEDDQQLQNAENLIPIVNAAWLADNPEAEEALNKLSSVLTTEDLTAMIAKVTTERQRASEVAAEYLEAKGLVS